MDVMSMSFHLFGLVLLMVFSSFFSGSETALSALTKAQVEVSTTIKEAFDKTKEVGYSRLPVYRKDIDHICGIFYVKDMPRWKGLTIEELNNAQIEQLTIGDFLNKRAMLDELNPNNEDTLIKRTFFAYETKKIGALIREMREEKQQMAILLDEYGGVSGLITTEDIVEEVLGEITDEYDVVDGHTIERDPNEPSTVTIDGLVSLRSVNKRLKLKFDESIADTLGGYVASLFGSIPSEGDSIADEKNKVEFEVLQMDGPRIDRVKIRRKKETNENEVNGSKSLLLLLLLSCVALIAASGVGSVPEGNWLTITAFSGILILSLILTAFYAGSETAVVSASKARIEVLAEEGAIGENQVRMIHGVVDLENRTIGRVMTPLVDIVAVPKETTIDDFYQKAAETGFSRIPVYEERVDNLIGLVNILDVLYSDGDFSDISPFIKQNVSHEPESKQVYALLRELQRSRNKMAFVVDEYGGVVGLVTIEDLVEEIMGEIRDERERDEEECIHQISDKTIECDGKMEIREINSSHSISIPAGDYETIAGYIVSLMGKIPRQGEFVETDELKIMVLDADARGVRRVRIHKK